MRRLYYIVIAIFVLYLTPYKVVGQSLPIGSFGLEDYYRRLQLLGKGDSTTSFAIRPLFPADSFGSKNVFDPDSSLTRTEFLKSSGTFTFLNGKGKFQILPLSWKQQFNTHHPYGWNDEGMIPSRGYESSLTGGFFAKFGIFSIQLRPEFIYAQNKTFEGFALDRSSQELKDYYVFYNQLDVPQQFGNGSYSKVNLGQSSIRLTYKFLSLGLSNENLWWGPGRQNSLLMTNNAPGFKHITLNSVKPINTPVGSFEFQIISARLENSNIEPIVNLQSPSGFIPFKDDWRYLTGFNISYQPKWVSGLFLGFARNFMSYGSDLKGLKDYLPFFTPVQKVNSGLDGDPYDRDQRLSLYARWLFKKAHAEVYFEYGLNDNSYNFRDFFGSPDHGRAYVFGFSKLIPLQGSKEEFIQFNAEIDQLSQSVDRIVRPAGGFYQHNGVRQGYTNIGQIIGAGTGSGGNLQSFDINWVKGLKKLGFIFERLEHNVDFYNDYIRPLNGNSRSWVDYGIGLQGAWDFNNIIFTAKIEGVKSLNYQWRMKDLTTSEYYVPRNDVFNLHTQLGISYRF